MNKEQFLAMSLPYRLYLGQHRCGKFEPYLFYGIKHVRCVDKISCYIDDSKHGDYQNSWIEGVYPILHPLTDLTKPIEHKGEMLTLSEMLELAPNGISLNHYILMIQKKYISVMEFMILIEHHFDVAGLIEKGEAIDVNTLPENPYK